MKLALRVLLVSTGVSFLCGMLVTSALFWDLKSLQAGGLGYVRSLAEVGTIGAVLFAAPLGVLGGVIALWHLRGGAALPRSRWSGRGSIVGVVLGGLGSAVWPLFVGEMALAGLYALLGSIAGAIAGAITGALLARVLGPDVPRAVNALKSTWRRCGASGRRTKD